MKDQGGKIKPCAKHTAIEIRKTIGNTKRSSHTNGVDFALDPAMASGTDPPCQQYKNRDTQPNRQGRMQSIIPQKPKDLPCHERRKIVKKINAIRPLTKFGKPWMLEHGRKPTALTQRCA
jgi:hypothetical protein